MDVGNRVVVAVAVAATVTVTRPRLTVYGSPLLGLGASDELGEHRGGTIGEVLGRDDVFPWCQLRRRRLHGLIERIPSSHRYRVTGRVSGSSWASLRSPFPGGQGAQSRRRRSLPTFPYGTYRGCIATPSTVVMRG